MMQVGHKNQGFTARFFENGDIPPVLIPIIGELNISVNNDV